MDSQSIAVFARYPSPGKVKTRLAATVGDIAASSFYRFCSETVLRELTKCEDTVVNLFVAELEECEKVKIWMEELNLRIRVMSQLQSENLGDRIFHSLKQLKLSGYSKVAAVATDIPDITHDIIQRGLALLDHYDVVMGPAVDGGFYFLGVKDVTKELFDNVEWSTSKVFDKMASNIHELQLTLAPRNSLPPVPDIDTFEDLMMWVDQETIEEQTVSEVTNLAIKKLRHKQRTSE